jgi:hypothetical protein
MVSDPDDLKMEGLGATPNSNEEVILAVCHVPSPGLNNSRMRDHTLGSGKSAVR